jgi:hypothetical protein
VGGRLLRSVDSPLPGDNDVIRRARIRVVSEAVFPASQRGALVGYIRRQFSAEFSFSEESERWKSVDAELVSAESVDAESVSEGEKSMCVRQQAGSFE